MNASPFVIVDIKSNALLATAATRKGGQEMIDRIPAWRGTAGVKMRADWKGAR
jgi:hypothetical protein